jgi:hypothetical protein
MVEENETLEPTLDFGKSDEVVVVAASRWPGLVFLVVVVLFLGCLLLIHLLLDRLLLNHLLLDHLLLNPSFPVTSFSAASLAGLAASFSDAYFLNCLTLTSNM